MSFSRFKTAQDDALAGFAAAVRELEGGRKVGHWIWYVFPQLANLGNSYQSRLYSLRDFAEAIEYLQDPELRERLERVTAVVANHVRAGVPVRQLMGSDIDAMKLVSSLTLFERVLAVMPPHVREVGGTFAADIAAILEASSVQGLPRCKHTLAAVG